VTVATIPMGRTDLAEAIRVAAQAHATVHQQIAEHAKNANDERNRARAQMEMNNLLSSKSRGVLGT